MPTTPYARLRVSLDGGSPLTGGITSAVLEQEVQLSIETTAGVETYKWLIVDYPPDFERPEGWLEDPRDGSYYSYDPVPDAFELTHWGKYLFGLQINEVWSKGGAEKLSDFGRTAISIESDNGLRDFSYQEQQEFNPRGWPEDQRRNLRVLIGEAGPALTEEDVQELIDSALGSGVVGGDFQAPFPRSVSGGVRVALGPNVVTSSELANTAVLSADHDDWGADRRVKVTAQGDATGEDGTQYEIARRFIVYTDDEGVASISAYTIDTAVDGDVEAAWTDQLTLTATPATGFAVTFALTNATGQTVNAGMQLQVEARPEPPVPEGA